MRCYRRRFWLMFGLALRAHLWLLVPVYGWANYCLWSAVLARLADGDASARPESVRDLYREIRSRRCGFLAIAVVTGTGLAVVAMLASLVLGIGLGLLVAIVTASASVAAANTVLVAALQAIAVACAILGTVLGVSVLVSRVLLADAILALESPGWRRAIARSWFLTGGNIWHTQSVLAIALVVMQPLALALFALQALAPVLADVLPLDAELGGGIGLALALNVLSSSLLLPVLQVAKGVLYYDLSRRRDGSDLQLPPPAIASVEPSPLQARTQLVAPERVALDFELAGLGNRAAALAIDYGIWLLLLTGFSMAWRFVVDAINDAIAPRFDPDALFPWLLSVYLLLSFGLYAGYFVSFETLWHGQTPGKRWLGLRVLCADGRPARLPQAALRALLRPLDDWLFFGLVGELFVLCTRREQRLGDWLAGTLVVRHRRPARPRHLVLAPEAVALASQLDSAAIARLRPADFAAIRVYLQRRPSLPTSVRRERARALAEQVRDRLGSSELPATDSATVLLEAVYLACQQQWPARLAPG